MADVKINLPEHFYFSASIDVRIGDLNYKGHVGDETILSFMHSARLKYLASLKYSEANTEGVSLITADSAVQFSGEAFLRDKLSVYVQTADFHKSGFDFIFKIVNQNNKEITRGKTGMLCYDFIEERIARMPEKAKEKMQQTPEFKHRNIEKSHVLDSINEMPESFTFEDLLNKILLFSKKK